MSATSFPTFLVGLFAFSYVVFGESRSPQNNWFKLGLAIAAFGSAIGATDAFQSLQSASSRQLMTFVVGILGGVAGSALLLSFKPGHWTRNGQSFNAQPEEIGASVPKEASAPERTGEA